MPDEVIQDDPRAGPIFPSAPEPPVPILPMGTPRTFTATSPPPAPSEPLEQMRTQINAIKFKTAQEAYDAAERFQAMRAYHADLQAGRDPSRWLPLIFKKNPSAIPGMMRERRLAAPPTALTVPGAPPGVVYGGRVTFSPPPVPTGPVQTEPLIGTDGKPIPGVRAARGKTGALHVVKETLDEPKASPTLNFQMLKTAIATTQKDLNQYGKEDPEYGPLKSKLDGLNAELEGMRTKKPVQTAPVTPQAPLPLPTDKSKLEKDRLYQTRRGVARWDGEKFIAQ